MNKNFRRRLAVLLTAAMTIGSAFSVSAAPVTLDGEGDSTGHIYADDVAKVTVPAQETLKNYLDFVLDPERLINSATVIQVATGTTIETNSVVANDNGIYFRQVGNTFGAISTPVSIEVKNYRKAKVSFEVGVKSGAAGDFKLVDDKATAQAMTTSAGLYLNVIATNGGLTADKAFGHAITSAGLTYVNTFGAQKDKFLIENTAGWSVASKSAVGNAKYAAVESEGAIWNKVEFQLEGYVSNCETGGYNTAPTLTYTWDITIPVAEDAIAGTAKVVAVNNSNYLGLLGTEAETGNAGGKFTEGGNIGAVRVNGTNVTAYADYLYGHIAISVPNLKTAGVTIDGVTPLECEFIVDGKIYTATYTYPTN